MAEMMSRTIVNDKNEKIGNPCKQNKFKCPNRLKSLEMNEILLTKVECMHSTPNKVNNLTNFNGTNCSNKITNSPRRDILFKQNDLLKSPIFKNKSVDVYTIYIDTPRERTINRNCDCSTFKLEYKNVENCNNLNFKKVTDDDMMQEQDGLSETRKNSKTDSHFISDCEEEDSDMSANSDSKFNNKHRLNIQSKPQERISRNNNCSTFKLKYKNAKNFNNLNLEDDDMMQEQDGLSETSRDSETNSHFISDCEEEDSDMSMNSDSKFNNKRRANIQSKPQVKRRDKYHFKKLKDIEKLSMKEKHLLKKFENFEEWYETIPLIDIKKLMNLHIKMIHKVPPQHKIESSGCHAPTREQKILFQKYGPIRKGSYIPTEDKIIRENWTMFCKLHDWDTKKTEPFLCWRHNGRYYIYGMKERQKFIQFLANGLPWRTLFSVYSRFKVLYRNKITQARYTSKEDEIILTYMQNKQLDKCSTKFSELAKILRRTGRSIFIRYHYLKNQIQKSKSNKNEKPLVDIKWTLPLIKKFIKTLLNVTLSEDIKELKDAVFPKPVWQKIEEKLNIHQNVLKTFWQHQLHLQLFSTGPIYLNDIKIQLIEYMYIKGISSTREIVWSKVAKYFDGATAVFLCKVFFYLIQECNMSKMDNFTYVVNYLYHTKIPKIQNARTDKFLPRIIYKNGKVSLLKKKNNYNQ